MKTQPLIAARVSAELKQRVQAAAKGQLLTESIWLRQIVDKALSTSASPERQAPVLLHRERKPSSRIYVRLCREDQLLLIERASARQLRPATYLAVLARAHLRDLAPLPKDELQTLKLTVQQLTLIGRNTHQLLKLTSANRDPRFGREELMTTLRICEALRDHVKALLKANVTSWRVGHDQS
jgi:hypothetical protein